MLSPSAQLGFRDYCVSFLQWLDKSINVKLMGKGRIKIWEKGKIDYYLIK